MERHHRQLRAQLASLTGSLISALDDQDQIVGQRLGKLRMRLEDLQPARQSELVGPTEIARITGASRSTVYRALTSGELVGDGRSRVRLDAVRRWAQQRG